MHIAELPHIDEHTTDIEAGVDAVWPVLLEALERSFSGRLGAVYARAIRCDEATASGPRPLAAGSTIIGFRVTRAVPESELALAGHHRFSAYTLTFRLEAVGAERSRLHAETCAAFPGTAGGVYRLIVIGTGGHAVAVRRMLSGIKRRAESRPRPAS